MFGAQTLTAQCGTAAQETLVDRGTAPQGMALVWSRLLRFLFVALPVSLLGISILPLHLEIRARANLGGLVLNACYWPICEKAPRVGDEWLFAFVAVFLSVSFLFHFVASSFAESGFVQGGCYGGSSGIFDDAGSASLVLPLRNEKDKVWAREQSLKYAGRWCSSCQLWKPPRAEHCDTVGHCVHRFSHYSWFLDNAVGGGNIGHFLLMVIYGNLGLTYAFVVDCMCLDQIWGGIAKARWALQPHGIELQVLLVLAHLASTLIALIVLGPEIIHVLRASAGVTGLEIEERIIAKPKGSCERRGLFDIPEDCSASFMPSCGGESSKYFVLPAGAYSKGLIGNMKAVLGLGWHLVCPIRFRMASIEINSARVSFACMEELKKHVASSKHQDENSFAKVGRRSKFAHAGHCHRHLQGGTMPAGLFENGRNK